MIKIYREKVSDAQLRSFLGKPFEDMVKFVVDVHTCKIAMGGELHADAEELMLKDGSRQEDLWGGNVYPDSPKNERIRYTSMINIRPSQGQRSMEIRDAKIIRSIDGALEKLLP